MTCTELPDGAVSVPDGMHREAVRPETVDIRFEPRLPVGDATHPDLLRRTLTRANCVFLRAAEVRIEHRLICGRPSSARPIIFSRRVG